MTETKTNARVTVEDGWAVRDLPNGDQVRAQLRVDIFGGTGEPERDGTGVLLVRERDSYHGTDLDEHDGLSAVLDRFTGDDYWDANPASYGQGAKALPVDRETFVRRYLRAFWDVEDAFMFRHRDHGDWADIWVIIDTAHAPWEFQLSPPSRAMAEGIVREWSNWAKGECYYAVSEYRTLADAMEAEDPDEGWTDHDTLHGGIGDDGALSVLEQVLYVHPFGDVDRDALPRPYEVTSY